MEPIKNKKKLVAQWIVGSIYLASGLVKLNDPTGFSLQLRQYFIVCSTDIHSFFLSLLPYSTWFSFCISGLEVLLGTALLVELAMSYTLFSLGILTFLFTNLSGYITFSNRLDRCGCFGDAILITPCQSLFKNILFLGLILWLIHSHYTQKKSSCCFISCFNNDQIDALFTTIFSLITAIGLGWYTFHFLPIVDFTPYKRGYSITKLMEPKAPLQYHFFTKKNGVVMATTQAPVLQQEDSFLGTILLNPEDEPAIKEFKIWDEKSEDITAQILQGKKLLIIINSTKNLNLPKLNEHIDAISANTNHLLSSYFVFSSTIQDHTLALQSSTPICTASWNLTSVIIKSDIGFLFLDEGTIISKSSRYSPIYKKKVYHA